MLLRLFMCIALFAVLACQSGRNHTSSRKSPVKSNARNSGANVWLVSDKASTKYHPRQSRNKASSAKVVENVSMEQWDCPGPETARYMPRSTKMKIRNNMRIINDELDGSQSSSGKIISGVVMKKGKSRNR